MAADRPGTSGPSLMVLVFWLRSVEIFRSLPSGKLVSQTSRLGIRPAFPQLKPKRSSATKSPDHTTSFHFKRRKRSGTLARASASGLPVRCVGLARQSIVMVRFSPLLPMASTGHPSMASLSWPDNSSGSLFALDAGSGASVIDGLTHCAGAVHARHLLPFAFFRRPTGRPNFLVRYRQRLY